MSIKESFSKSRILVSRLYFLVVLFFLLFTSYSWEENSILLFLLDQVGFVFLVLSVFGRIWASLFISGYKKKRLITQGPYSIMRNPLYFFSLIGMLGIGLASRNILVFLLLIVFFSFYYPFVIKEERDVLQNIYKKEYDVYRKKTPAFLPRFSLYQKPERYLVKVKGFTKNLLDASWFFWFYLFVRLIQLLHVKEILPILFRFP